MGVVIELTSVVRSTVENVSSPTLLMRDVMRSVRDVLGRTAVGVDFAVAWIADTPLIPVTSKTAIARTESFLRFIIFVSIVPTPCDGIYGMLHLAIFSRLDIIGIGNFRKMRMSNPDMSQDDTFERAECKLDRERYRFLKYCD